MKVDPKILSWDDFWDYLKLLEVADFISIQSRRFIV